MKIAGDLCVSLGLRILGLAYPWACVSLGFLGTSNGCDSRVFYNLAEPAEYESVWVYLIIDLPDLNQHSL